MSDGQNNQTGGEDLTGLRNALSAERARATQLESQLNSLRQTVGDLDLAVARQAITERDTLQGQVQSLQGQLHSRDIQLTTNRVLSSALPEYRDLLSTAVQGQLQVNDQGQVVVADGRSLEQVTTDLKTKYPTMFGADQVATGAGTTPSNGGGTPPTPTRVSATDTAAVSQLDPAKVASGEVVIDPI